MTNTAALIIVYCGLIVAASVTGGSLPRWFRMTHLRTQLLISGVGGLMLGIALLHLLPHAMDELGSSSKVGSGVLIGLIAMFLLVRVFDTHEHSHGHSRDDPPSESEYEKHNDEKHPGCDHSHSHDHGHWHVAAINPAGSAKRRSVGWVGLFLGLALHTMVDGVALASSVIADVQHGSWLGLAGLGTFLAVALHKPLDSFAITSVMKRQRWSEAAQLRANLAFAMSCPIGAAMFYFGANGTWSAMSPSGPAGGAVLGWGLAISSGFFIGIALADLLPEVAFHDHDKGKLTAALLLGVSIAVGIENLPGHTHPPHRSPPSTVDQVASPSPP